MSNEFIWVERFRPKTIDDCILPDRIKTLFKNFVKKKDFPNLILSGGSGVGKTTIAKCLVEELDASYMFINGSLYRNLDTLRIEIMQYASSVSLNGNRKYVIIDEADYLNALSTQPALRNFMEEFSSNCFHGNTKVATLEYGAKPFKELVDQEITVKCKDGIWRKVKVKHYGKQKVFKYKFSKHNSNNKNLYDEVIATENHTWFLENGNTTTSLTVGDKLQRTTNIDKIDNDGIIHGLIFGDGVGMKISKVGELFTWQGTKYPSIRICKKDSEFDEIVNTFLKSGYNLQYPSHTNGDPVIRMEKKLFMKDFPHTTDPGYISGFIYGWWLADGKKLFRNRYKISTIREDALEWLKNHVAYAGLRITGLSCREEGAGGYRNSKKLYEITLSNDYAPTVRSKEYYGISDVYCVEEPVTNGFVLANGLLTGNCGFIFTCNYPGRIIKELHSRCTNIKFDLTKQDFKELGTKFYVAVQAILDQEKIEYEKPVLAQVINKYYPDFRKVINELQAYSSNGKIDSGILSQSVASNLQELVALIKNKDYDGMTEFILTVQPDNAELIKFLFAAKNQFLDKKLWPDLVLILNEGQKNDAVVLDKQVNNLAILTEIMVSLK